MDCGRTEGSDKWNENLIMYANYARADGSLAIGAQHLIEDLSRDPDGIAYSGIRNLNATNQSRGYCSVARLSTNRNQCGLGRNRKWPLYQRETWLLNRKPGTQLTPKVLEFMPYVLSREGQREVVRDGKFLSLTGILSAKI